MEKVICVKEIKDTNNNIVLYRLKNEQGHMRDVETSLLKRVIENGLLEVTNLDIKNNKLIIDNADIKDNKHYNKYEAYELYQKKQAFTGRIFDFEVTGDKENSIIRIVRYYDIPERTEVVIPRFVDGFTTYFIRATELGAFSKCKYIKKINSRDNINGSLLYLFREYEGDELDLTEFDTTNIYNMDTMFYTCKALKIVFGGKFTTENVTSMKNMFNYCETPNLDLTNSFNTLKVKNMSFMFYFCMAKSIKFGEMFNTSKVMYMTSMFSYSQCKNIDLNFNTFRVIKMDFMFSSCMVNRISLGNKFLTSGTMYINQIFSETTAKVLIIGKGFTLRNVKNKVGMFKNAKIKEIRLSKETDEFTLNSIKGETESLITLY